jgi:phosphoribosylformylglycinamidine synthase subunit PurQ / glutaminase
MKAGVITFPGSNCDDDAVYVLEKLCEFQVTRLWHKDSTELSTYSLVVLPGGFSYGDYLRCGAMASLSPIMQEVKKFAENGGMVIGICNGFQILCEAGLLPGALARNQKLNFVCSDVALKVETTDSPWSSEYKKGETIVFPIAHGEGRYIVDEAEYQTMKTNGQIILTYTQNPNGSSHDIAGVCNAKKNVFGLMPHPERATDLRSQNGVKLWNSIKSSLRQRT